MTFWIAKEKKLKEVGRGGVALSKRHMTECLLLVCLGLSEERAILDWVVTLINGNVVMQSSTGFSPSSCQIIDLYVNIRAEEKHRKMKIFTFREI
jgi:hypothetical protein